MRSCIAVVLFVCSVTWAYAQTAKLESPATQVRLLELYTSEGCSSCPPADRWLSSLTSDARLWAELVPVAFHVDYWDYIGWPDRYALPDYGERQRNYARAGNLKTVYTPGFVLNGKEWRRWFSNRDIPDFKPTEVGALTVDVTDGSGHAEFHPSKALGHDTVVLHLTVLGFDLKTDVGAGENRGRRLEHDFTVLSYSTTQLQRRAAGYGADVSLPEVDHPAERMALAAWVTEPRDVIPLQATGGWLKQ